MSNNSKAAELLQLQAQLASLRAKEAAARAKVDAAILRESQAKADLSASLEPHKETLLSIGKTGSDLAYTNEGWEDWIAEFRQAAESEASSSERRSHSTQQYVAHGNMKGFEVHLLSREPMLAFFPEFASAQECAACVELGIEVCRPHRSWASEAARPPSSSESAGPSRDIATSLLCAESIPEKYKSMMESLRERVALVTGIEMHEDEVEPYLKFDRPLEKCNAALSHDQPLMDVGLHVDVNGNRPHRVCTLILYLNDVPAGGETVFPIAPAHSSIAAAECGRRLLAANVLHTSSDNGDTVELRQATETLLAACADEHVVRVHPQRGSALMLFSLGNDALPDPCSWHGGAAVSGAIGKWTLQFFREVKKEDRSHERSQTVVASLRTQMVDIFDTQDMFSLSDLD